MIEEGRAIEEKDLEKYLEVNEAFHKAIADASGNRVLAEYVENILARTNAYIVFYDPSISLKQCQVLMPTGKSLWLCDIMMQKKCVKLLRGHLQEAIMGLRKAREEA